MTIPRYTISEIQNALELLHNTHSVPAPPLAEEQQEEAFQEFRKIGLPADCPDETIALYRQAFAYGIKHAEHVWRHNPSAT